MTDATVWYGIRNRSGTSHVRRHLLAIKKSRFSTVLLICTPGEIFRMRSGFADLAGRLLI
jgi:hypothetical protein